MLRLHGVLLLLACVVSLGWGAAGAATPKRAAFKVTLTGTLTKDWTVTRTVEGDCTKVATHTGRWRMALGTRRSSRIALTGRGAGRRLGISPSLVRTIAGNATQGGSVRVDLHGPRCTRSIRQERCARKSVSFRGAIVRLTSPRAGTARFGRLQGVSAARSFRGSCPEEPADIRGLRTDLDLADAPLAAADVFARDVPRFFISGNTTQETTIEGEFVGKVTERVRWTLTFTRMR
ncbi:MAG TPA: hypothetical protein VGW30_03685 [Gaiellaceae bacterium]|nr:hypothetical protein [Gaiellaceae bacterium]